MSARLWSLFVAFDQPTKADIPPGCRLELRNVSLSNSINDHRGRSTLRLDYATRAGDETISAAKEKLTIVCTLLAGVIEQTTLSIPIFREDGAMFSVLGKNDMYLTGTLYIGQEVQPKVNRVPGTKAPNTEIPPKKPSGLAITTSQGHNSRGAGYDAGTAFKGMPPMVASASKPSGLAMGGVSNGFGDRALSTSTPKAQTGLKYKDVVKGTGDPATNGCNVTVHYTLREQAQPQSLLTTSGDAPISLSVGGSSLVPGLAAALPGMLVGGTRQLLIPYQSIHHKQLQGLPPLTPSADLLLECELCSMDDFFR